MKDRVISWVPGFAATLDADSPGAELMVLAVIVQLIVIIVTARVFAVLFRKLGQPTVVGEIAAGLALGPSCLGKLFPGASAWIFDPNTKSVFEVISQIGLIFLLFLVGSDCDFGHLKNRRRAALGISLMGVALPFALGWVLAYGLFPHLETPPDWPSLDMSGFALFIGTAMSITAIPVLGRIMMELNITRSRIGTITMTAAAIDDFTGWILLGAVGALVRANFDIGNTLRTIAMTVAFILVMVFVARPLLRRWARWVLDRQGGALESGSVGVVIILVLLCSAVTNLIGIFSVFGAFVFGATLSTERELCDRVAQQLRPFVTVFFLPIFFTFTGLKTDVGTLSGTYLWMFAIVVLLAAIVGKFGGCSAAAWFGGFPPREAACIGILMNTRGLMELVVANVGLQLRVIPPSVYCMLVLMALITTAMATPVVLRLSRNTELEPFVARSSFGRRRE
jgi:Kef-type K+ transport system membrane component KefB